MNWRDQADKFGVTVEQLKEQLPLEWVIGAAAEIPLDDAGEGRAIGYCPFHDDEHPSLDVYGYGTRWGCFPCGSGGDLFDFIGQFWELDSFQARLEYAVSLLRHFQEHGGDWHGVVNTEGAITAVDDATVARDVFNAQELVGSIQYPISQLLRRKGIEIPESFLMQQWRIGVTDQYEVLAPYYADDGTLVSYKTRLPGTGSWYATAGRKLTSLYGEWLLGDAPNVWLCEGETDTWLASWLLRGRGVALGLPTGAGAQVRDEWAALFQNRRVTLVFDADAAGRRAARRWYAALLGIASEIHITWPDGDLCESPNPAYVLDAGVPVRLQTGFVIERVDRGAYLQVTRQGPGEQITNWVFEPTRYLSYLSPNGKVEQYGYEGYFTDDTTHKRLVRSTDLENGRMATRWANKNGVEWYATSGKWTQAVLNELNAKAPFLPRAEAVSMVGLHGVAQGHPVFVLPDAAGGVIGTDLGKEKFLYYPEGNLNDFENFFQLRPVEVDPEHLQSWASKLVSALLQLNERAVVTPILSWIAAAPLRSMTYEFPSLAVLGGSGSGKTTMLAAMLKAFYGVTGEQNLSRGTTPYGLTSWAMGTNALPIWYDEYRNQAPLQNLEAMDQMLRDAWTASSSSRGGMSEERAKVRELKITAPIVVSGETAVVERSHVDRIIVVSMPDSHAETMDEKALSAALLALDEGVNGRVGPGLLGRVYLEWLLIQIRDGWVGEPVKSQDRQQMGENVLRWGWDLWTRHLGEVYDLHLGPGWELDLSKVQGTREDAEEHPILTALSDALEEGATDQGEIPVSWIIDPGDASRLSLVAVRPQKLHIWAERTGHQMPGNAKATREWLRERFIDTGVTKVNWKPVWGEVKQYRGLQLAGVLEAIEEDLHKRHEV